MLLPFTQLRHGRPSVQSTQLIMWFFGLSVANGLVSANAGAAGAAQPQGHAGATAKPAIMGLSVSSSAPGTRQPLPGIAVVDLGKIDTLTKPTMPIAFVIANDTPRVIRGVHVEPACGCTSIVDDSGRPIDTSTRLQLEPGKTITLRATLETRSLFAGTFEKTIRVFEQGARETSALVRITGDIQPLVIFDPPFIDLGKIDLRSGSSSRNRENVRARPALAPRLQLERTLMAYVDKRLVPTPSEVALTCTSRAVSPELIRTDNTVHGKPNMVCLLYRIGFVLKPPLGLVQARVRFAFAKKNVGSNYQGEVPLPEALVVGKVIGDVRTVPEMAALGTVVSGREYTTHITIYIRDAALVNSLTLGTDKPWLILRFASDGVHDVAPLEMEGYNRSRVLEIRVLANAPSGPQEGEATIMTPSGEKYILPVQWYGVGAP